MATSKVSPALDRLFRAEIANEREGGVAPARLWSALDSVRQGYDTGHGDDSDAIEAELEALIREHGEDMECAELHDPENALA